LVGYSDRITLHAEPNWLMRLLWTSIALATLVYLGLCAALFVFQRSMIYMPQPRAVMTPQAPLRLRVDDAELVVSVRPRAGAKALVYFGGNAEDVSLNLDTFGQWFPEHALYLLHYRGYGGSSGTPGEAAIHSDAAALFRAVAAQHADVAIVGRSLGAGVAVRLAVAQPTASRLVLITPFHSLTDIAAAAYPFVPVRWLLRDTYESGRVAPGIRMPTTIIAAEHDEVVPLANTAKLFACFASGVATMKVIPGAGHNTLDSQNVYRVVLQAAL
jgi:uncharacterized protein